MLWSKFLSRKFLLALGTVLVLIAEGRYGEAAAVAAAYVGAEGLADAFRR